MFESQHSTDNCTKRHWRLRRCVDFWQLHCWQMQLVVLMSTFSLFRGVVNIRNHTGWFCYDIRHGFLCFIVRLVSALCPVTLMMCLVGIWVASRICTDVALKLWFVYFWLREAFWLRTDIIVPANEKLNIMMLSNRADRSGQIVEIQISIQSLHSGCFLNTLLYSKTMLFKF